MNRKECLEAIKQLVIESTIPEIIEKCNNGELNENAAAHEIWVSSYAGTKPEEQAYDVYEAMVDTRIYGAIKVNPTDLFKVIYAVKDYAEQQDAILIFNNNVLDAEKFASVYDDGDMFLLSNYLNTQKPLYGNYQKETFDPFAEEREKYMNTDEYKKQKELTDKFEAGEITYADLLEGLGLYEKITGNNPNIDYDKINSIIAELINGKIELNEIHEKCKNNEITLEELQLIVTYDKDEKPLEDIKITTEKITSEELIAHMYNWYNGTSYSTEDFINLAFALNSKAINYDRIVNDIIDKSDNPLLEDLKILELKYDNHNILSNVMLINDVPFFTGTIVDDRDLEIFFTIYWDGSKLQVHIPVKGNAINPINGKLFFRDHDADVRWVIRQATSADDIFMYMIDHALIKAIIYEKEINIDDIKEELQKSIAVV